MSSLHPFLERLERRYPGFDELHQAVSEVARSVWSVYESEPRWLRERIFERLVEPDRVVSFRVCWTDDQGALQIDRGFRVQQSNALGPYKGGLRFHPGVNESIFRFLAFEQVFKNSLTGLPLGGAKGGATFDPRGRSDMEVMRFCQAFMSELRRFVSADLDVPAGDQGVGGREIGFLYGAYRRYDAGVFTGKPVSFGGIPLRPAATGYGLVHFLRYALWEHDAALENQRCLISGAGDVALFAAEKLIELGAHVHSLSDTGGAMIFEEPLTKEDLALIRDVKQVERGALAECAGQVKGTWSPGGKPWAFPADIALPCATQNELDAEDAKALMAGGAKVVAEGANMPCTAGAVAILRDAKALFLPGKAANAGGVAVSGMEMAQNAQRLPWTSERVGTHLQEIMRDVHTRCVRNAGEGKPVDYVRGANVAGFLRLAEAVEAQGIL